MNEFYSRLICISDYPVWGWQPSREGPGPGVVLSARCPAPRCSDSRGWGGARELVPDSPPSPQCLTGVIVVNVLGVWAVTAMDAGSRDFLCSPWDSPSPARVFGQIDAGLPSRVE